MSVNKAKPSSIVVTVKILLNKAHITIRHSIFLCSLSPPLSLSVSLSLRRREAAPPLQSPELTYIARG